jgi:hypothetical protein
MAKTTSHAFSEFQKKYEPRPISVDDVASKHRYLRQTLGNKLDFSDDYLIGSYVKNTQIWPRTDIDIFMVLDNAYLTIRHEDTPRKVFGLFLRNLRRIYPKTTIRSDGQAVTIQQAGGFRIDVIPAYETASNTYIIPNQHGQTWIRCNPKVHISYLIEWNKALGGKLKPIIKMAKCWAKMNEVPIRSFHLELLVVEAFKPLTQDAIDDVCSSYSRAMTQVFQQGCILIDNPFYDEMHERVDEYLDTGNLRKVTWAKFQHAATTSTRALHIEKKRSRVVCHRCLANTI